MSRRFPPPQCLHCPLFLGYHVRFVRRQELSGLVLLWISPEQSAAREVVYYVCRDDDICTCSALRRLVLAEEIYRPDMTLRRLRISCPQPGFTGRGAYPTLKNVGYTDNCTRPSGPPSLSPPGQFPLPRFRQNLPGIDSSPLSLFHDPIYGWTRTAQDRFSSPGATPSPPHADFSSPKAHDSWGWSGFPLLFPQVSF